MGIKDYRVISTKTNEANLYYKDGFVYKIYKPCVIRSPYFIRDHIQLMKDREKKVAILKEIDLPNTVMPIDSIYDRSGNFAGYSMRYIPNVPLRSFDFGNSKKFLCVIRSCSETLRLIHEHPAKLCVGDMHFGNIILDGVLKPYYIDCDSWSIGKIDGAVCMEYFKFTQRKKRACKVSSNSDNISLFINTYKYLLGNKDFECIDEYDYDQLAEQSSFLKNSKEIFHVLSRKGFRIAKVPYIDEFIDIDQPEEIVLSKKR